MRCRTTSRFTGRLNQTAGAATIVGSLLAGGLALLMTPGSVNAQGFWSPPSAVAAPEFGGTYPDIAMDGSGNAVAVWNGNDGVILVARYAAGTQTWSVPIALNAPGQGAGGPHVAMDAVGNAVVSWIRFNDTHGIVQAAYYSAAMAAWSGTTDLSAAGQNAQQPEVALDGSGNAVAVWLRFDGAHDIVQTARFAAATGLWSAPLDLSVHGERASEVTVAVESGGAAAVAWVLGIAPSFNPDRVVQVARYRPAQDAWSAPANLATATAVGDDVNEPSVAIDVSGNVIAVWRVIHIGPPQNWRAIRTAFYNSATGTWTAAGELAGGAEIAGELQLAMDRGGHAIVLWTRVRRGVQARRYSPGTGWAPIVDLEVVDSGPSRPGVGDVLAEHPTLAVEGNGNAVAAWGVRDYGTGVVQQRSAFFNAATRAWTGGIAMYPEIAPAVAIGGGDKVMAVWSGVGVATAVIPAAPSLQPAAVTRPMLTLTWTPPAFGPAPTSYTVVASATPDGPLIAVLPVELATSVAVQAPDGIFFVRVVATAAGTTIPSNQITVVVARPPAPGAPLGLGATVSGSTITLSWSPPANGALVPVRTYVIEAGGAPGLVNLANFATGNDATTFVAPPVPNGSYYVRLRARNESGTGPATADLRVVVGPPPPGPPTLTGTATAGGYVSLAWTPPTTGAVVTGYLLQAGTLPGLSNAAVVPLPPGPHAFATAGVPPGTYYVRIVANSAAGLGEVSNEIALAVP